LNFNRAKYKGTFTAGLYVCTLPIPFVYSSSYPQTTHVYLNPA
jgi:hypothetical protein